jgi:hypothetical protein
MEYEYSYRNEEMKRCHYCKMWIEYRLKKIMCNRSFVYFHPECFEIFKTKICAEYLGNKL